MAYETILYDLADDVASVRMNDPATRNALSLRMAAELIDALDRAGREARAMLLGGVGPGFCSGANLAAGLADLADPARDVGSHLDSAFHPLIQRMRDAAFPIVTAVQGSAAGIGCSIALAGDLIVAGEGATFFQAFAKIGLVPDGGSTYLLTRAIGRPRAMEMMLLGGKLPAATALAWGLVNRVVPDAEVDTAGLALARELAAGPRALGLIKRVAWAALDAGFEAALANERLAQREAGRTEDFVEGVAAFGAKRAPVFKGR